MNNPNYLSPQKREEYEDRLEDMKGLLRGEDKNLPHNLRMEVKKHPEKDTRWIEKRIREIENVLEKQTAPTLNDTDKSKVYYRFKDLKEELTRNLLTYDEMMIPTQQNINKYIKWDERFNKSGKVEEFKNCCRILDRDDELIGQLEGLRKTH